MTSKPDFVLNDHRFLETITCPQKLPFLLDHSALAERPPAFRQKNKLRLRDAIALQFKNCKHTSDDFETAAEETERWLKEPEVAICGAVIKTGGLITRIPILVKKEDHYTLVQVHGKLRKRPESTVLMNPERKRSTAVITLKAAYRAEILSRSLPQAKMDVHLYFPQKSFFAATSDLNAFSKDPKDPSDETAVFQDLFVKVDATDGVNSVRDKIPAITVHPAFKNLSVGSAIQKVMEYKASGSYSVERHAGCVHCPFRKSKNGTEGCWEKNFSDETIRNKALHVPDLLGIGNSGMLENGIFFQEEVQITGGLHEFDLMIQNGGPIITMQQRRALQVLRAKEKENPILWIKKDAKQLHSLRFPLHFIDFEAATYAIPMRKGDRPYTPLYFQFSCHTLSADGTLQQSGWLHSEPETDDLHTDFTAELLKIPKISRGTIVHYSPFEKQAIQRMTGEFQRDKNRYSHEIEQLRTFLTGTEPPVSERFVDLSEYIRRYYYNSFMSDSLGLKETLESALKLEQIYPFKIRTHEKSDKTTIRNEFIEQVNPYQKEQNKETAIMDGSSAMHAWIAQKSGLLNKEVSKEINRLLHAYCEIDSLAMVFLYKHMLRHLSREPEEDTILF